MALPETSSRRPPGMQGLRGLGRMDYLAKTGTVLQRPQGQDDVVRDGVLPGQIVLNGLARYTKLGSQFIPGPPFLRQPAL